jgi:hypothetical protein
MSGKKNTLTELLDHYIHGNSRSEQRMSRFILTFLKVLAPYLEGGIRFKKGFCNAVEFVYIKMCVLGHSDSPLAEAFHGELKIYSDGIQKEYRMEEELYNFRDEYLLVNGRKGTTKEVREFAKLAKSEDREFEINGYVQNVSAAQAEQEEQAVRDAKTAQAAQAEQSVRDAKAAQAEQSVRAANAGKFPTRPSQKNRKAAKAERDEKAVQAVRDAKAVQAVRDANAVQAAQDAKPVSQHVEVRPGTCCYALLVHIKGLST